MRKWLPHGIVLLCLLPLTGDARPEGQQPAKAGRLLYPVRYRDAKELAGLLGKHFKADAKVEVLPDEPSNTLLINAPELALGEIRKALDRLDRAPRVVAVDVLIIHVKKTRAKAGKPAVNAVDRMFARMKEMREKSRKEEGLDLTDKELRKRGFAGSPDEVAKILRSMLEDGEIAGFTHVKQTTVENQEGTAGTGTIRPYVAGVTKVGEEVRKNISYKAIGTYVTVTPRVKAGEAIVLKLVLNDSRMDVPEDGMVLGKAEDGSPVRSMESASANVDTEVRVASGGMVVVKDVKTESKTEATETVVLVAARVIDGPARREKK